MFEKFAVRFLLVLGLALPAVAYSAPKTVLVVGDSLSAEYGIARGTGWVSLLEQKLKAERIDARVINASISGETSSGGRARMPALIRQHKPDIVVIELGANDGLRGLPVPAFDANLRAMTELATKNRARVLLVGMRMPPNYGRDYTNRFTAVYGKVARDYKAALVPFMLDGVDENDGMFQQDRLHPVAAAHPTILANIWPQFSKLVKNR